MQITTDTDRPLPHTLIVGDRGEGKTTEAVALAADWQDAGYEVIFLVPEARHVDVLYPLLVETLDMSRVQVWTVNGAVDRLRGFSNTVFIIEDTDRIYEKTLEEVNEAFGPWIVGRTLTW